MSFRLVYPLRGHLTSGRLMSKSLVNSIACRPHLVSGFAVAFRSSQNFLRNNQQLKSATMILDNFYATSSDLLAASMEKHNTRSNVFIPRADAPEFKPRFSPQPNDGAFKSCWMISSFSPTEFAFDPQVGQFHPQAKVSKNMHILGQI